MPVTLDVSTQDDIADLSSKLFFFAIEGITQHQTSRMASA